MRTLFKAVIGTVVLGSLAVIAYKVRESKKQSTASEVKETITNVDIEDLISETDIVTIDDLEQLVEIVSLHYVVEGVDVPLYAIKEAALDRMVECTGKTVFEIFTGEYDVNAWMSAE